MAFKIRDLKELLYSLENKEINEINMKSTTFELIINTNKIIKTHESKYINTIPNNKKQKPEILKIKKNTVSQTINNIIKKSLNTTNSEVYSTIISPMVGTFYRSPAPNEKAFIEQYDYVERKQTVCIIEAMKLMNEIEAEVNGEIVEILVKDGDIVDCGQALMKVKLNSQ
uniref:Biotin carboxyl carrier protein of acetyl-CoA carboxylase n=1 Tax=Callithamnion tetricum TaxID=193179 RepID=A0A4D6WNB4_9FLOR|nr:acetyl-CoA carboxylase, biotin carboxyl carrier protein [Callithamnion tetricum]